MTEPADDPKGDATFQEPGSRRTAAAESPARSPSLSGEPDFGPRYRVVAVLGKGGMGEVYRAYDVELRGEVALKVIRTDVDTEEALARFRREIALARKVTNPNVLRVYDLAEHKGLRFLSMEYVEGEDLSVLLKRERRLPTERALSIFRQVATGLAAAHAEGVVHRDLKPQNVLLDREGNVRIADFGLARSMGESGMTASGAVLGSPAYMSPEQVKGEPTDARSDIYSLGVMLYQLASGQTPFQAPTTHAVMEMRLHKRPPPLREVAPEVSVQIERVVERCLELDVAKRYASVSALIADLDAGAASTSAKPARDRPRRRRRELAIGLGVGGAAVAAIAIGLFARHSTTTTANETAARMTDAGALAATTTTTSSDGPVTTLVLGFDNHTLESEFDGMLDAIVRSTLRRSTRVDPIAGAHLRRLASDLGPNIAVDDKLGAALAARDHRRVLVVHGKVDSKGSGFLLSLVAKDATTGDTIVDKTMEATSLDRVVPTVARLATEIRRALGEKVSDDESERTGLSPLLGADHEFVLGSSAAEIGNFAGSADHLQLAVTQDPAFSLAHARRAVALRNLQRDAESSRELQLALRTIDQMAERDRLKTLGDYYQMSTEEYDRSIASYTDLLAKWPHDESAQTNLANTYQARGDAQKALDLARKASGEHPNELVLRGNVAAFEINADDFEGAVADCRKMLAELPRPTTGMRAYLTIALSVLGRHDEAMQALADYQKAAPSNATALDGDIAFSEGRLGDAISVLDKGVADDLAGKDPDGAEIKSAVLAEIHARLGDKAGTHAAALLVKTQPPRRFTAALALLAIGDTRAAKMISADLAQDVAPSRRVMAKMIDAEALRVTGKPRDAMVALQDAIKILDVPMSHFLLARAALDAKDYAEAYSELMHCLSHRGTYANAVDDVTGVRYVPQFTYYLAQAQDGLGSPQAAASYQAFLAMMHTPDANDPLVADARRHVK